jgi:nitrogen fixation-related uncharacterized protein
VRSRALRLSLILGVALLIAALAVGTALAASKTTAGTRSSSAPEARPSSEITPAVRNTSFKMLRSTAAVNNDCLEGAYGKVTIRSQGDNQIMDVTLNNMPKNTGFTLFVLQQPDNPFGVAWYQGDIETNGAGRGTLRVIGIFSEETFAFAEGVLPAPQVDDEDAEVNPAFDPVHTLHLGAWFAEPEQAEDAGCSETVTRFDGDHVAGIQALSTKQFDDLEGPLCQIQ